MKETALGERRVSLVPDSVRRLVAKKVELAVETGAGALAGASDDDYRAAGRVLVLGAGVAGLQAIATARRLGATVEAFDVRKVVKEQVESLGARFVEVDAAEDAATAGGYAKETSEAYKQKQAMVLREHL